LARLYANENVPQPVVDALRALGHDILTTRDVGRSGKGIPDSEVLRFAVSDGRAVVTINRRDFIRLHQQDSRHAGIIVCSEDADFSGQGQRIHAALSESSELAGRLIRVNRPGGS
jgi:predicted nuclease of predicted toxin-antitoxin system